MGFAQANDQTLGIFRAVEPSRAYKVTVAWNRWDRHYYHDAIKHISIPLLLIAGGHEHLNGIDSRALAEDASRVPLAGPALILDGFSHFLLWEQRTDGNGADVEGRALVLQALDGFHTKWQGAMDD